ncbi:MAG: flagellar biosynthesis protein FliQ [Cyanobacteria bacterium]|nr:flagellar biosynthesis protein FliQ [Cyanobacteriota bacterium]
MTEKILLDLMQHTLWLMLLLGAPVLVVSLVVGVLISILQAVTQIQESTLTFVPKILASMVVIILTGPWMLQMMVDYTQQTLNSLIQYTH